MVFGEVPPLQLLRTRTSLTNAMFDDLKSGLESTLGGIIPEYRMITHDVPHVESIDARFFLSVLREEYGAHTLCVTDAKLKNEREGGFYTDLFGGVLSPARDVGAVSTKMIEPKGLNNDVAWRLFLDRLVKVSLHEEGHMLGLVDHPSYQFATDGWLCLMSRGPINRFGTKGYVTGVIDQRGFKYCFRCQEFLTMRYGSREV